MSNNNKEKSKSNFILIFKVEVSKNFFKNNHKNIVEELSKEIDKDEDNDKYVLFEIEKESKANKKGIIDAIIMIKGNSVFLKYNTLVSKVQKLILENKIHKSSLSKIKKENEAIKILYEVSSGTYKGDQKTAQEIRKKYKKYYGDIITLISLGKSYESLLKKVEINENVIKECSLNGEIIKGEDIQKISLKSEFLKKDKRLS